MLPLLSLLVFGDSSYARAESLLARHQLPEARAAAEQLVKYHPGDERAHLLLGRVMFEWPVTGRYDALTEFRLAERLAPDDPEPPYREAMVGFFLHSDDGEALATASLIRVFAADPAYRDAWIRFTRVFQNPSVWREAEEAFARHPHDPRSLRHRADLALKLGQTAWADSFAAEVLALSPHDEEALLVRAEAGFLASPPRDFAGYAWYDSAVTYAAGDTANAMWDAIWMIASPEEAARYDSTPAEARPGFLRAFWDKRDPNLVTSQNERIAEHFRRLVYAETHFRLLHPQDSFFYSPFRRDLMASYMRDYVRMLVGHDCLASDDDPLPAGKGFLPEASPDAWLASHGLGPDFRSVDSSVAGELMARTGFDSRGLVYVRYGPPDAEMDGAVDPNRPCNTSASPLMTEGWSYNGPSGPLTIAFNRFTSGSVMRNQFVVDGDFLFMPITERQVQSARYLMHTDRTAIPAPLLAHVWNASFRDTNTNRTRIYFRAHPDTAAARLWDDEGNVVAATSGVGLISLAAPPGHYQMGVDVDSAGRLGRARRPLNVEAYPPGQLTLSSLVLSAGSDLLDRDSALRAMPATLTYRAGTPLTAYTEIYWLGTSADNLNRYQVEYTFAHTRGLLGALIRGRSPVAFSFTREGPAEAVKVERLTIEAGRLPAGSYRVTLTVTDLTTRQRTQSVAIDVDVR